MLCSRQSYQHDAARQPTELVCLPKSPAAAAAVAAADVVLLHLAAYVLVEVELGD